MKAQCTNDRSHSKFIATAHVVEEWVVDARGHFVESKGPLEVASPPDPDNQWTCAECGADVKFMPDTHTLKLTIEVVYDREKAPFSLDTAAEYLYRAVNRVYHAGFFTHGSQMRVANCHYDVHDGETGDLLLTTREVVPAHVLEKEEIPAPPPLPFTEEPAAPTAAKPATLKNSATPCNRRTRTDLYTPTIGKLPPPPPSYTAVRAPKYERMSLGVYRCGNFYHLGEFISDKYNNSGHKNLKTYAHKLGAHYPALLRCAQGHWVQRATAERVLKVFDVKLA